MASMDYEFRNDEKIADVASQFNTTVSEIMRLNNVQPPYPTYIRDLPSNVIEDGTIELPYVANGRQTFESYYNTASVTIGVNYVDVNALEDTLLYNSTNRYYSGTTFTDRDFTPGDEYIDCYIAVNAHSLTAGMGGVFRWFPCYPESISDSNSANYSSQTILGRSEPFQYYTGSGPRTVSVKFQLHSDMCGSSIDYIYKLVDLVEACCYPNYNTGIAAPKVTLHVADNINITGIITSVNTDYSGPILPMAILPNNDFGSGGRPKDWKYSVVDLSFSVTEVTGDPPSFSDIARIGGRR